VRSAACKIGQLRTLQFSVWQSLCAFAKLGKRLLLKIRNVCLPVRVEQLGFQWTNFREISYLTLFLLSVRKIQDTLKSVKDKVYLT